MVFKLIVLVGLGRVLEGTDIEEKRFFEPLSSKNEITKETAEAELKDMELKDMRILNAFIVQSGKFQLDNGKKRKILATWNEGEWT